MISILQQESNQQQAFVWQPFLILILSYPICVGCHYYYLKFFLPSYKSSLTLLCLRLKLKGFKLEKTTAVLFLCHIINPESIKRFKKLELDGSSLRCETFWCLDIDSASEDSYSFLRYFKFKIFPFSYTELNKKYYLMRYPSIAPLFMGNHLFPLLDFAKFYEYDNYWFMENDVIYKGNWSQLFSQEFNDSTLMIQSYPNLINLSNSKWFWVQHIPKDFSINYYGSLVNIIRVSKKFITRLDQKYYEQGPNHRYHAELFFYTVLMNYSKEFTFKVINCTKYMGLDCNVASKIYHNPNNQNWLIHPYKLYEIS